MRIRSEFFEKRRVLLTSRLVTKFGVRASLRLADSRSTFWDLNAMSLRRLATKLVAQGRQWFNHLSLSTGFSRARPLHRPKALLQAKTPITSFTTTSLSPRTPPSSSWTTPFGTSLAGWTSSARATFVNGLIRSTLLPEANVQQTSRVSRELRRGVARRLMATGAGDSPSCSHTPFLGLVGLGLASNENGIILTEEEEFNGLCHRLKEVVKNLSWVWDLNRGGLESEKFRAGEIKLHLTDLKLGPMIGKGANAAVHAADWADPVRLFGFDAADPSPPPPSDVDGESQPVPNAKRMRRGSLMANPPAALQAADGSEREEYPLALKMMFNYDIRSDSVFIMRAMKREVVPCLSVCLQGNFANDSGFRLSGRLPPHPNVALCYQAFVDSVSCLPGSAENYGDALPARLNPDGLGRNMSLFVVMKRYELTLAKYLEDAGDGLSVRARGSVLTQVLEGVSHLVSHGIAHRDVKSDNVLISCEGEGFERPHVVLSDFGCCLDDPSLNLKLPFSTYDTDRGGNRALMAPEVVKAVPGLLSRIDYSKADVWAVGTLSYEIFGERNPFYGETALDSACYDNKDLPPIRRLTGTDAVIHRLVFAMLDKNPRERLSAAVAANVCQLLLWGPKSWMNGVSVPPLTDIMNWILSLTTKVIFEARDGDLEPSADMRLEFQLATTFLSRLDFVEVRKALDFICRS